MDAIEQCKAELAERLDEVIDRLAEREPRALLFFLQVQHALRSATEEEDLITVFILLSTTAFQGFQFPEDTLSPIDALLGHAERIAHTFTASESQRH